MRSMMSTRTTLTWTMRMARRQRTKRLRLRGRPNLPQFRSPSRAAQQAASPGVTPKIQQRLQVCRGKTKRWRSVSSANRKRSLYCLCVCLSVWVHACMRGDTNARAVSGDDRCRWLGCISARRDRHLIRAEALCLHVVTRTQTRRPLQQDEKQMWRPGMLL